MADKPHLITTIFTKLIFTIIIGMMFLSWDIDNLNDYQTIHQPSQIAKPSSPHHTISQDSDTTSSSIDISITQSPSTDTLADLITMIAPYRGEDNYTTLTSEIMQSHIDTLCQQHTLLCKSIISENTISEDEKIQRLWLSLGQIVIISSQQQDNTTTRYESLYGLTIKNDHEGPRGYANHHHIVINIAKISGPEEFVKILSHEIAHILDLGVIQGRDRFLHSDFTEFRKTAFAIDDPSLDYYRLSRRDEQTRLVSSQQEDFCTRYGMTNPFEDLAECITLYLHHHDYFLIIKNQSPVLQAKYDRIAQYLNPPNIARSQKNHLTSNGHRYRDSTKIGL